MNPTKSCLVYVLAALFLVGCGPNERMNTREDTNPPGSYELVTDWPQLPDDLVLGNPTGLGMNSKKQILVFHRASRVWEETMPEDKIRENTILVIDSHSGKVMASWGADLFIMPHGLEVDKDDNVWVTDVALHQVFKFGPDKKLLMTLGEARVPGDDTHHFFLPTDVAVAEDGSFYVSDGYGNSRVVKFAEDGTYLLEWGTFGTEPGAFNTPHGIDLDHEGNVYVADRENNRIQKFDPDGNFIGLWQNTNPSQQLYSVALDNPNGHLFGIDYMIVADTIVKGSDIFRFDLNLKLQKQFGRTGQYEGPVSRYHDILVDEEGSLYLGDILGNSIQKFQLK